MKKQPFTKQALKQFFYWINERHAIYIRRHVEKKPWPWTKDPILQQNRFCSVFRELDKTTIWIRENWREPYADHKNLWFAMAMARQINKIETLAEIGFPKRWQPERVQNIIRARMARGEKAYTGAYMITGSLGGDKPSQTAYKILDPLYRKSPHFIRDPHSLLEEAFIDLVQYRGFGRFLAYEVVTDLRHTRYLCNAPDIMTWANAGPGAHRGLRRLQGFKVRGEGAKSRYPEQEALDLMRWLLEVSPKYIHDHVPPLEMRDVEHVTCEIDKYLRAKNGEGRLERYRYHSEPLL